MTNGIATNEWLSATQVAEKLNLHVNTVKRLPPEQLPYCRMTPRGDRKYRPEDVEAYIDSRMVYHR